MRDKSAHLACAEISPACSTALDALTGVNCKGRVDFANLVGKPTVCGYCGAIAVFADQSGLMRTPTEAESASIAASPEIMQVVEFARQYIAERAKGTPG